MGSLFTTGEVTQSSTGGGITAGTVIPAGTEITGTARLGLGDTENRG